MLPPGMDKALSSPSEQAPELGKKKKSFFSMIEKQHEREEGEIKDSEAAKTMKNYLGYY